METIYRFVKKKKKCLKCVLLHIINVPIVHSVHLKETWKNTITARKSYLSIT